ncbi:FG-GAP-like repeat-containing protein, partial [Microcoleus sp. ARI1-A5]
MIHQKLVSILVFIDSSVEDYQSLISGVSPKAEVIILDETLDGIKQITERLTIEQNIEAIHIISHGSPGAVQLGTNTLNNSNIESLGPQLKQWRKALIPGADILLYGCNVAADVSVKIDSPDISHIPHIPHIRQGLKPLSHSLSRLKPTEENLENSFIQSFSEDFRDRTGVLTSGGTGVKPTGVKPTKPNQFLQRLSELTGADIAASANLTGNAALGGDWELEVHTGLIETPIPFNANTLKTYRGVLGFATKVDFPTGSYSVSVSLGDINGDKKPDLAVANIGSANVSILLNTTPAGATTPTFTPQATFPTGTSPVSVSIGDINGDGKPDVAVVNRNNNSVSILLNTAATGATAASFATQPVFTTGPNPLSGSLDDFNGDGKLDLALAIRFSNAASVLLNTTATGATTASFAPLANFGTGSEPYSVSIGDFNGDGKPDLASANFNSNSASVLLNTTTTGATTASFAPQAAFATGTSPGSVSMGDINGDGKLDLAVANGNNSASILLNTTTTGATTASFAPQAAFATGTNPLSVSISDINGDGKPDLAVANNPSNSASILLNTTPTGATTPTFATPVPFPTGNNPFSVSIDDINGDGKPDLAVANRNNNSVSILLNTTPKVTAVTATTANGSYKAGDTIAITVTFDAAVNVDTTGGTPQLQLETGTTDRFATYASGSGGTVLTFNYVVQPGDTSGDLEYLATTALTLNGGTIKETAVTAFDAFLTLPTTASANSLGGSKAIVIDTTAPTVALTSASATTVNGLFRVTATFSENVTGFDNTDITLANATVGNFVTVDGKTYTFDVTPNADGAVTVDVLAAKAKDTASNNNTAATQLVRTADVTAPTVALTSASPTTINAPFLVTATFSENVTGFSASGINVINATVSGFTGSGTTYNFTVTPNADGNVTVDVPEAKARDTATNNNTAATQLVRTADITPPTVALTSASPTTINAPFLVTATFSENVTGFSASGINVINGTVSGFTGSGTTYNFTVTPNADGNVT